jgi:catechol 2,3-dioxygenase-like lactoylglutathione lyase family enzyme
MSPSLHGQRTVIYPAPDLDAAKAWWTESLGAEPYFDHPFYVGYNVAGYELGLLSDGAPEDGAPEDGAPEDGAPEDGAPEDGAPEDGAPEDGAPEDGAPEDGALTYSGVDDVAGAVRAAIEAQDQPGTHRVATWAMALSRQQCALLNTRSWASLTTHTSTQPDLPTKTAR